MTASETCNHQFKASTPTAPIDGVDHVSPPATIGWGLARACEDHGLEVGYTMRWDDEMGGVSCPLAATVSQPTPASPQQIAH